MDKENLNPNLETKFNDYCSSDDKSCAAINACSKDGIYSILTVILSIAIILLIYFIAKFLL